ncbi:MAG TPA: DUF502 domain-containing protein [Kiritimatiellia bacterium]|nr:DUF502 domain-containing protein [Kiritimatiellia bacterium]
MARGILKSIRTNILVGLILVTPIVVTAFVVNWLFTFITNRVLVMLPRHLREGDNELLWRVVALIIVLVVMFFVGVLIRNILGKRLYKLGDNLISRIPLINRIYVATRQIITSIVQQRKTMFQEAVLIQYPRPGIYSVGFVTAVIPNEVNRFIDSAQPGEECVSVFIPTTPNPTSGWLCMVPRSQIQKLNMTSGEAMRLIVSGGAVFPGDQVNAPSASLVELVHELVGPPDAEARPAPQRPVP